MLHTLIAATAEAGEAGAEPINPILAPHPGLMFWTIVAFTISLWVLHRYAFGPIQEALDRRRETINGALEHAERMRAESEERLRRYEEQLAGARAESEAIVERARRAGDELTQRVRDEVEGQRQEQLAQTQAQIRAEMDKAMEDIRAAVAEMTVVASEKVLRQSLDGEQHRRLVEQAVEELDLDRLQKIGAGS